ncbi:MoxR family ATPase [Candidatus Sumerlaeota bacterium]|nr:MoxR family ATPase [Candidatus Sumerlaeota bacterium]
MNDRNVSVIIRPVEAGGALFCAERLELLRENLRHTIQGKDEQLEVLLIALVAEGSVLMEDIPGVGKTTLAKALARSIDSMFSRVQFTPDLLPADILGGSIYNPVKGKFEFRHGPVFCNVLLADEINRASPRTQSALLEAMSECQATIEGGRHDLPRPFMVLATQNPVEFHGTYPLPEAQLDRFLITIDLGYPDAETETDILYAQADYHPLETLEPVVRRDEIYEIQAMARQVRVDRSVAEYIVELINRTRHDARLKLGASPRGSLMLFRTAQAAALVDGRDYVLPDDVQRLAPYVLAHRVTLTSKARYSSVTKKDVIQDILTSVRVPA